MGNHYNVGLKALPTNIRLVEDLPGGDSDELEDLRVFRGELFPLVYRVVLVDAGEALLLKLAKTRGFE
jgi:hypothetical protein